MQNKHNLLIFILITMCNFWLVVNHVAVCLILGMSTLERKTNVLQEFREKGLKTYIVSIYLYVTCTEMCYCSLSNGPGLSYKL